MSLQEIANLELSRLITEALQKVFVTMLDSSVEHRASADLSGLKAPFPELGVDERRLVFVGSVGMVGELNGIVYLYMQSDFAESVAKKMTGMDVDELDFEIVSDVCGEMTNMFAGSFKNALAEHGYESVLTIPSVLSGDELFVSTFGIVKHLRYEFASGADAIVSDLVLAD